MLNKNLLAILMALIICLMLFCNKKVRVFSVLHMQLQIFKNAKTGKISFWDIFCFMIFPIVLAVIIVEGFNYVVDQDLAIVLTSVFAIVFTVLFGFAAILVGKLDSKNDIERQVVSETFVSIMTSNLLSLISAIMSIVLIIHDNVIVIYVFSICVYSFSFMIIMLLLMISKRTFIIYSTNME